MTGPDDRRVARLSPRTRSLTQELSPRRMNINVITRIRDEYAKCLRCEEESPRVAQLSQNICENNCEKQIVRREPNLNENDCKLLYFCETPSRVAQLIIE